MRKDHIEINTSKGKLKAKILIGADGPQSEVARSCGLNSKAQFFGIQSTVEGKFDDSFAELYFGSKVAPKYFAWFVPINKKKARIGLATKHNAYKYYKDFTKSKLGYIPKPDVSGAIKCKYQNKIVSDRVLLIGDAASQVKPFSGGGITYSLIASQLCAHAAAVALESERYDEKFLKRIYQKRAHSKFKIPIIRGLIIHRLWQSCPDFLMNTIFYLFSVTKTYKLAEKLDVDFY